MLQRCCMPLNPFYNCFTAAPQKIHHFLPKKTPKHANLRLGGQFVPLVPYFEDAGHDTMCCMPFNPFSKCFRGATTRKHTIFAQKWPKMSIFTRNQCLLGPGGQIVPPPTPFWGCLTHSRMMGMQLNTLNKCSGAATTKKNHFSVKNSQKIPIFTPNQCFPGLSDRLVPPPLFSGCWFQRKMSSIPLEPYHNCFWSILPYVFRSGHKISNVHNLKFDIWLNNFTTCRPIFDQECFTFTPMGKLHSKYL